MVYLTCFIQASFTYRHLCYMAHYLCKQNQDEVEHIHSWKFFFRNKEILTIFLSIRANSLKTPKHTDVETKTVMFMKSSNYWMKVKIEKSNV